MFSKALSDEALRGLTQVDSPTVANVIELFNVRSRAAGYPSGALHAVYPELPPIAGYAVTATFRAAYPAEVGDNYSAMPQLIEEALAVPAPRIVVFQDLDEPSRAATYGEIMVSSFQKFDFSGLITSGAARDILQVKQLQFPCWASSVIVSHGYCRFVDVNVPVNVGGLLVKPGDLLHADANGIINIPHAIAGAVAELSGPYMQAEQIILDYLKSSDVTPEGYSQAVTRSKNRISQLSEEARRYLKS
ncbi:MAG: RraA family protein [Acidobacteriota bacterium]